MYQVIALAELVTYIKDVQAESESFAMFKLKHLVVMYSSTRVQQLGTNLNGRVNSTHLKDRILAHFPDMQAHKYGREIILIFSDDVGTAMRSACENEAYSSAIHLARAAQTVRRELFNNSCIFTRAYDKECQELSIPSSLSALMSMILY